ncbi:MULTISPECIES: hypothetical protein [Rhizobium]|jgi:hypothetical protein|uniref:hypothetical protein n=1 Tax=Rhizobium TaxID=379 RepID=UPI00103148FB|nr:MULTISPECIES: hypothetical protein [Rhizobium]MBY3344798.1 hypothetical protein [Rhizobium laguerreae]MBY3351831.1 hypothetical protein [Rhizobium laguerreae]MBY3372505.1 hypothetical protein [Rhizobium laguerreae]MBY3427672.1 hypothetical protein [Rhizobium laguerreae]MBY3436682.1 hypothetical protein [Rhizobium laguerreae]
MDELTASARKEEAERLRKVLKCSEAKQMPALAEHLAFETDETAKSCLKILKIAVADSQATPARP